MPLTAVKAVEPAVRRAAEKLVHEVDAQAADRLAETLRRIFDRGEEPGEGGLFERSREEDTG